MNAQWTWFMNLRTPKGRLLPWYVGLAVIAITVVYAGYEMIVAGTSPAPTAIELIVLVILPAIYLGLMYLTLTSQK